jgi:Holliday junction resolvasome RuvABC ATP-dependent DNA helicase subunit
VSSLLQLNTLLILQVLLLCGPPGLGKTTLAHVAVRHCGYHVVEVCFMVLQMLAVHWLFKMMTHDH